jgi:hypothetical protein
LPKRLNYGILIDKIKNMESQAINEKPHKEKIYILIELFIKKPVNFPPERFKSECVACSRLVKRYPNFDFFYSLPELTEKFNSLFGLLMKKNKEMLDNKYKDFLTNEKKEVILEKYPVIEIKLEKKKSKSIMDFLNS